MLSQTSEYAMRAVCAMASRPGRLVSTSELAEATGVPMAYLAKVLQQLASAEIIRGRRGVGGGYRLVGPPEDVSLLDVVRAIGSVRDSLDARRDPNSELGFGALSESIEKAEGALSEALREVKISAVCETNPARDAAEDAARQPTPEGSGSTAREVKDHPDARS